MLKGWYWDNTTCLTFFCRKIKCLSAPAYLLSALAYAIKRNQVTMTKPIVRKVSYASKYFLSLFVFLFDKEQSSFDFFAWKTKRSVARVQSLILLFYLLHFIFRVTWRVFFLAVGSKSSWTQWLVCPLFPTAIQVMSCQFGASADSSSILGCLWSPLPPAVEHHWHPPVYLVD